MYELGISTMGGKLFFNDDVSVINEEFFCDCQRSGIKHIEISLAPDQYYQVDYKAVEKMASKYNVNLWAFHLPFQPAEKIEISSPDKDVRKSSLEILSRFIKQAGDMGINKYVIHPSFVFEREEIGERGLYERMQNSKESLVTLADVAERAGGVMALENLPPSCLPTTYEEHLDLLGADSRLRACFDTNHIVDGDPSEHIRALGDKLITLHVSDYDLLWEKHWFPGEGALDWNPIVDALNDINYKGVWLYEISFGFYDTLPYARRNINCDDVVKNAEEILNKKDITVIK